MSSPIVETAASELRKVKRLAELTVDQLDDEQVWRRLDPESNSVGVLMRHMAGNMRSRWTDLRTTDGEKPDRQRDQEFEDVEIKRQALLVEWEDGWQRLFDALSSISDADLQDTIYIREEPHTIHRAIVRQIVHYAGHAYQILALGKHLKGSDWKTLSVPRGKSDEFNQRVLAEQRARE